MKKILITVHILNIGEDFDIFIPIDMKVLNVISLIQKSISDMDQIEYIPKKKEDVILIDSAGKAINSNNIVKFSGLKNGSRVVLI